MNPDPSQDMRHLETVDPVGVSGEGVQTFLPLGVPHLGLKLWASVLSRLDPVLCSGIFFCFLVLVSVL